MELQYPTSGGEENMRARNLPIAGSHSHESVGAISLSPDCVACMLALGKATLVCPKRRYPRWLFVATTFLFQRSEGPHDVPAKLSAVASHRCVYAASSRLLGDAFTRRRGFSANTRDVGSLVHVVGGDCEEPFDSVWSSC